MANIYHQRMIEKRKMNNLCIDCGNPLDRDGVRCIECNNKHNQVQNENRRYYQSLGFCPRCKTEKLYGEEKMCINCSSYMLKINLKNRDRIEYNKSHAEWSRRTHKEMNEKGICYRCRKRKADIGYKTCGICRAKIRESKRTTNYKPNRKDRYIQGLCYFCDNKIKPSYKLCEIHYQRMVDMAHSDKSKQARAKLIQQGILY